ncbi:heterokaryon incompatibility protein-domain-containing protein [Paraphoma chrysanthemicola]|uniref:Heterokaryon incompatibility protein-domain-containing protein n=1 Tax=Paraphoma chrysanthemicola TaxID=798071 RepID=A0A8K0RBZ2_9PLEO|nr:heterokaryon incompatibility protein-domain-containing protein [Paraphoma chrysanthemicola]
MIKPSRQPWKQLIKQYEILGKSGRAQRLRRPHFIYAPLPPGTIRLLRPTLLSQPGERAWDLETVRIDEPDLKFNALSYTWGLRTKPVPITLNNQRFLVQRNLYSALPYLAIRCMRGSEQSIWIDALCINQADEEEKTHQIRLMSQIYRKAQSVWVWLGLADKQEMIPEAISMLEQWGGSVTMDWRVGAVYIAKDSGAQLQSSFGLEDADPALLSAIRYLLHNPWFRRVWIVQEAALAREIVFLCGQHDISAEILEQALIGALLAAGHHPKLKKLVSGTFHARSIFNIRRRVQSWQTAAEVLLLEVSVMMAAGNQQCLMPEDRVRGVAGMSSHEHLLDMQVAGRSHIPFLYTAFSRDMLLRNDSNTMLWWYYVSLAFTFKRRIGLPSWVPDLHRQDPQYLCRPKRTLFEYTYDGDISSFKYQASRCSNRVKGGEQWNELVMEGKFVDRVACVYEETIGTLSMQPQNREPEAGSRYIFHEADWETRIADAIFCLDPSKRYENPNSSLDDHPISLDTYVRTLAGGMTHDLCGPLTVDTYREFRKGIKESRQIVQAIKTLKRRMANRKRLSDHDRSDFETALAKLLHSPNSSVRSWNNALSGLGCRQLFLTERARLGFAMRGVKPGDAVCVFNGAFTPHMLRQARNSRGVVEKWRFVSDAYVHGLMDGEADAMQPGARDIVLV